MDLAGLSSLGRTRRCWCRLGVALLGAAMAGPPPAVAGTATLIEDAGDGLRHVTVHYAAEPGEVNDVRLTVRRGAFGVSDAVPVEAGDGCTPAGPNAVSCKMSDPAPWVRYGGWVEVGDGDDQVTVDGDRRLSYTQPPIVAGGPGNDRLRGESGVMLRGGDGEDVLIGSPQWDTLWGGGGRDVLQGAAGNDSLAGDRDATTVDGEPLLVPAADTLDGGLGTDAASYDERTRGVAVDLAAGIGGEPGEADTLRSIEHAYGGHAGDRLAGDPGDNRLVGNGGNDELIGGIGDDWLDGDGQPGRGENRLFGNAGDDHISGGGEVSCGSGEDRVGIVDRVRPQPRDCELVDIDGGLGSLLLSARPIGIRGRAVVLRAVARCSIGPCPGRRTRVTLHSGRSVRRARLATGRFRIPALRSGARRSVRVSVRVREGVRPRALKGRVLTVYSRARSAVVGGGIVQARYAIRVPRSAQVSRGAGAAGAR